MVPAIRRLIQKGMPLYAATTFIMVGPILNPIVFLSTFTAFRNREAIAYSRMGLAFLVALAVGLIVYRFVKPNQLKGSEGNNSHDHEAHHHPGSRNKLLDVMGHSIGEFFEMGKYLMFAAVLVGLLQTFVSKSSLTEFGQEPGSANLIMMGLGFLLSLCSTSDAFVAQSFVTSFSKGSLVAFMVFGPMLNLKSLLMMAAIFKPKFVAAYSTLVFVFVYTGAMALEWLALK